ncbi:hypothetical protein Z945_3795 [Sulfitobacter noctilucae]|nr:hypothetical protein Z945_3795 [Sulfitobacter noctilucae]
MAALSAAMTHLQAFGSARLSIGCHSDIAFWFSHATRDTRHTTRELRDVRLLIVDRPRHATRGTQQATRVVMLAARVTQHA